MAKVTMYGDKAKWVIYQGRISEKGGYRVERYEAPTFFEILDIWEVETKDALVSLLDELTDFQATIPWENTLRYI